MRYFINTIPVEPLRAPLTSRHAVHFEASPVSHFLTEKIYPLNCDRPIIHFGSDICILLNQRRLGREFSEIADDIMSRVHSGDISDQFSGLSDDDILSCVKSRYIQSPSEVKDWTTYLMSELERIGQSFEPSSDSSSEPSSEPSNTD